MSHLLDRYGAVVTFVRTANGLELDARLKSSNNHAESACEAVSNAARKAVGSLRRFAEGSTNGRSRANNCMTAGRTCLPKLRCCALAVSPARCEECGQERHAPPPARPIQYRGMSLTCGYSSEIGATPIRQPMISYIESIIRLVGWSDRSAHRPEAHARRSRRPVPCYRYGHRPQASVPGLLNQSLGDFCIHVIDDAAMMPRRTTERGSRAARRSRRPALRCRCGRPGILLPPVVLSLSGTMAA